MTSDQIKQSVQFICSSSLNLYGTYGNDLDVQPVSRLTYPPQSTTYSITSDQSQLTYSHMINSQSHVRRMDDNDLNIFKFVNQDRFEFDFNV